jgi:hypothetical protein
MCEIIAPFKGKKQVIGYKVALTHKGRFYSPSSGVEYKVGKIVPPDEHTPPPCGWCDSSHDPKNKFFRKEYTGLTAVLSREDAESILTEWLDGGIRNSPEAQLNGNRIPARLALVKIRLGGVRSIGWHWGSQKTHLGSIIREIEEAK